MNQRNPKAFTLIELLLVIGIIAILISLLVPTVTRVRIAGQKVATQSLLNRISAACEAYFQDHNAYPGPFSDDFLVSADITSSNMTTQIPALGSLKLKYANPPGSATYVDLDHTPTSSENLFLGLCGGLRNLSTDFVYDAALAERAVGPQNLRNSTSKKSQSYFQITPGEISSTPETANPLHSGSAASTPSLWWANGNGYTITADFVGDSRIYEFVDAFKIRRPILYLRAKRGVTRAEVSTDDVTAFIRQPKTTTFISSPWQYDPSQIQYAYSNTGLFRDGSVRTGKEWHADAIDFPSVPDAAPIKIGAGDERYFANEALSTGNAKTLNEASKSLVPIQKDKFILISAGPDGLYGTADDIRN